MYDPLSHLGTTYDIEIEFINPMLGTTPKQKDVYRKYVAQKAIDQGAEVDVEAELETVQDVEEKGWTGFHVLDKTHPFVMDYVILGFLKAAGKGLRRTKGALSNKVRAYRKKISEGIGVYGPDDEHDRYLFLHDADGNRLTVDDLGLLERPLRADTPQGERVSLVRSDTVPPGTRMTFRLRVLADIGEDVLQEWFAYGAYHGLGQWRNAQWGIFRVVRFEEFE